MDFESVSNLSGIDSENFSDEQFAHDLFEDFNMSQESVPEVATQYEFGFEIRDGTQVAWRQLVGPDGIPLEDKDFATHV